MSIQYSILEKVGVRRQSVPEMEYKNTKQSSFVLSQTGTVSAVQLFCSMQDFTKRSGQDKVKERYSEEEKVIQYVVVLCG